MNPPLSATPKPPIMLIEETHKDVPTKTGDGSSMRNPTSTPCCEHSPKTPLN